jgi:hypothetical protein
MTMLVYLFIHFWSLSFCCVSLTREKRKMRGAIIFAVLACLSVPGWCYTCSGGVGLVLGHDADPSTVQLSASEPVIISWGSQNATTSPGLNATQSLTSPPNVTVFEVSSPALAITSQTVFLAPNLTSTRVTLEGVMPLQVKIINLSLGGIYCVIDMVPGPFSEWKPASPTPSLLIGLSALVAILVAWFGPGVSGPSDDKKVA